MQHRPAVAKATSSRCCGTLAATNKNKKYKLAIVDYEKNSIRKSIGQLIKRYFQALLIKYEKRIGSLKLIGNIKR
jgi:hypothetical protein